MKVKPINIITIISILSLITVSIMYGAGIIHLNNDTDTSSQIAYSNISTMQLQIEVERLSQKGELPFSMGLELIERWTHK